MSKNADYYITGVWKDAQKRVTHVKLHIVNTDNSFSTPGIKTTKDHVISLIKLGKDIKTIVWKYPNWSLGAKVDYEKVGNTEYLRTVANANTTDNLDNSLPMNHLD